MRPNVSDHQISSGEAQNLSGSMFDSVVVSVVRLKEVGGELQYKDVTKSVTLAGTGDTRTFDISGTFGGGGANDYKAVVVIITDMKKYQYHTYKENYKIKAEVK